MGHLHGFSHHFWLVQGYTGHIAVLTPYAGQLRLLKSELQKFTTVRISERDQAERSEQEVGRSGHLSSGCGRRRMERHFSAPNLKMNIL